MVDLYLDNEHLVVRSGLKFKTNFVRYEMQCAIDYLFTSKKFSTDQLRTEVDAFYDNQLWHSRLALRLGIKKVPLKIRAFEQELSDRV